MTPEERSKLIDRLTRSYIALPHWAKVACKHSMGAPTHHPETGKPFETFREVIEAASDETLLTLKEDFTSNEDLAPEETAPEPMMLVEGTVNTLSKAWVFWQARIWTHHKEEHIPDDKIEKAIMHGGSKIKSNFPNPSPETLALRVRNVEGNYVWFYAPLQKTPK